MVEIHSGYIYKQSKAPYKIIYILFIYMFEKYTWYITQFFLKSCTMYQKINRHFFLFFFIFFKEFKSHILFFFCFYTPVF
ncbi:hypothetical protein GDO86_004161 [Hymenochirus boettgeri]|uniref:Uncharacterized protein n=1 Tax=Hymenochirus boettgeri TaxID=247094 RepID=A0A8T2K7S9_9PIPI|nr:hypothetical protein GDO86_004161 [Hymenochirus boettgeri]